MQYLQSRPSAIDLCLVSEELKRRAKCEIVPMGITGHHMLKASVYSPRTSPSSTPNPRMAMLKNCHHFLQHYHQLPTQDPKFAAGNRMENFFSPFDLLIPRDGLL